MNKMKLTFLSIVITLGCSEDPETLSDADQSATDTRVMSTETLPVNANFHAKVGAPIAYDVAQRWMNRYKSESRLSNPAYSHFFGKESFARILDDAGCVGISINYAIDDDGNPKLILAGIDGQGKVMAGKEGSESSFEDESGLCPPLCPEK